MDSNNNYRELYIVLGILNHIIIYTIQDYYHLLSSLSPISLPIVIPTSLHFFVQSSTPIPKQIPLPFLT